MKKKMLAILLATVMVMTLLPMTAFAADEPWDGNGTKTSPWLISDLEDLVALDTYVESGETCDGKYFKLTADIGSEDGDKFTTPIGSGPFSEVTRVFKGNFDGDGHTVWLDLNGGATDGYQEGLALFAATINATISNVTTAGTITFSDCYSVGGIVGYGEDGGNFTNCINKAVITSDDGQSSYVGGLFGQLFDDEDAPPVIISNCKNEADITVANACYVGGIVGQTWIGNNSHSLVSNCGNSGDISVNDGEAAGGVVGYGPIIANRCWNTGDVTVTGTTWATVGGFAGCLQGFPEYIIRNSYSVGNVTNAVGPTGGFVGNLAETIENCYSVGNVKATANTEDTVGNNCYGGFCGAAGSWGDVGNIINCYCTGTLTCEGAACDYLGGFCGDIWEDGSTFENCFFDNEVCTVADANSGVTGVATAIVQDNGPNPDTLFAKLNSFLMNDDTNEYALCSLWKNEDGTYPVFAENVRNVSYSMVTATVPVPDPTFTIHIPKDTNLAFEEEASQKLNGSVYISDLRNVVEYDKQIACTVTGEDLKKVNGDETIPTAYLYKTQLISEPASVTKFVCGEKEELATEIYAQVTNEAWYAAKGGDYSANIMFTFSVEDRQPIALDIGLENVYENETKPSGAYQKSFLKLDGDAFYFYKKQNANEWRFDKDTCCLPLTLPVTKTDGGWTCTWKNATYVFTVNGNKIESFTVSGSSVTDFNGTYNIPVA